VIAQIAGRLLAKDLDRVEVMTSGGVGYELAIPLGVYETLPRAGEDVMLHTHLVVREDANGVGPALALGLLSHLSADRLVRALREKDVTTLQSVPRVGRKKAERLVLDLADKLEDLPAEGIAGVRPDGAGAEDAIRALVSLGYTTADAERAVRGALDTGGRGMPAAELIRNALARLGGR
jgi:Holliday junction DNA helicase RuvA